MRLLSASHVHASDILKLANGKKLFVIEEVSGETGIAAELALQITGITQDYQVISLDLGKEFIPHGSVTRLYEHCNLDSKSIADSILGWCEDED